LWYYYCLNLQFSGQAEITAYKDNYGKQAVENRKGLRYCGMMTETCSTAEHEENKEAVLSAQEISVSSCICI